MTEFQLKTNPFASSMATGCSVLMTSDRVVGRNNCYDGSNTDDDDDVMHMDDSGSVDSRANNGQWVRLSKSLLLQLVERICMLSFQQVENQSHNSSAQRCADVNSRLPDDAMDKRRGVSSPDHVTSAAEGRSSRVVTSSPGETDAAQTMLVASPNKAPSSTPLQTSASKARTSPSKVDRDADSLSPIKLSSKRRCLVRTGAAAQNAMSTGVAVHGVDNDVSKDKSRLDQADDEEVIFECDEKSHDSLATDAVSAGSNVVNKSCSLARRRHRLNAANVLRRHRQRSRRRRSQMSRRGGDDPGAHRGLLKRPVHQTWLALNKSLVLCALDRALSTEDSASAATTNGSSSSRVAKSIWNPATSLSRYEARAAKLTAQREIPVNAACFSPMWLAHPSHDPRVLACTQAASLAAAASSSYSCANSSLLCALLGFDAGSSATDDVTNTSSAAPPAHDTHRRTASEYYAVARAEMNESIGESCKRRADEADTSNSSPDVPVAFPSFGTDAGAKSPEKKVPPKMTSPPRLIVSAPSICRGAQHRRGGLMEELKPGSTGDKWIVLDKGDVYSLVESLVNTMIASGAPGERRRIASSAEHTANKEPRKWKSNLLQRLRTETQ